MLLDPRRYEVAIKELQSEMESTKAELNKLKQITTSKLDSMLCTNRLMSHTSSSTNFNLTNTQVDLLGTTLRLYYNGTSKSAITAGNITNITVATFVIDNSDLLIKNVWNNNSTGSASGALSQYYTAVSMSDDRKTITVTLALAAIGTNISSGGTQNAYITLPVTLNYDAF